MCELLKNLDRLHTTPLGVVRIKRNLGLDTDDVVRFCKQALQKESARIERRGKNLYVIVDDAIITINAHSYTIITAHHL